ncbi:uncharacterized protein LOC114175168 [Vigna unguiculata]|uniref:uncharacterized protein LOC114175168 n=1 Tax=Vigna unguiculata TaxID=3917 RepID=UPI001016757F|nr:uncharacterized protein LOC114175168 [Vigna unguiculata]
MDIRQQSLEGSKNEVMPAGNEMNGVSPRSFLAMNEYEHIMAFLSDDNDNSQQEHVRKKSKTLPTTSEEEDSLAYLFQLDHPLSLQDILGQDQTLFSQPPQSLITNTTSTIQLNPINISVSTGIIVPNASKNMAVVNSIFSSENCSSSGLSLPAGSNALYAPETGTLFGDSIFPKTTGYSYTQFESPTFPVQPFACARTCFGTGASASASGFVGNYETQLQSPSLVHPYAGPSVGTASGANNLDGNSRTPFQSPCLVHPYAGPSAGRPSNLDENLLTQFQSPSLVHAYAGPSVGSGVGVNNLDANSLTQFQSPGLVHPYAGSGVGAKNLDGNSVTQHQLPGLVHPYAASSAAPSVGSASDASNLDGNSLTQFQSPSHEQFSREHRLESNPAAPSAPSAMGARPQYQTQLLSRQPFLRNFNDFELAWEM